MVARTWILATLLLAAVPQVQDPRPRDPWVYRAKVEALEDALVIAVHTDLWVAYDPRTCSLSRAWRGGEKRAADTASRWLDGPRGATWWLVRDGNALALEARWRGYVLRGGQVTLNYELDAPSGPIAVEETPELVRPADLAEDPASIAPWVRADMVGLRRSFRAKGVPEGAQVCASIAETISGGVVAQDLADPIESQQGTRKSLRARLPLEGGEAWNELIYFFDAAANEGR